VSREVPWEPTNPPKDTQIFYTYLEHCFRKCEVALIFVFRHKVHIKSL
jgi:hypothetical protein